MKGYISTLILLLLMNSVGHCCEEALQLTVYGKQLVTQTSPPTVSPDGNHIAWALFTPAKGDYYNHTEKNPLRIDYLHKGSKVWISSKNSAEQIEIPSQSSSWNPSWSSDTKFLAYYSDSGRDGITDICMYSMEEKTNRKLASLPISSGIAQAPIWSSDNEYIYVHVIASDGQKIYQESLTSHISTFTNAPKFTTFYTNDIICIDSKTGIWHTLLGADQNILFSRSSLSPSGLWLDYTGCPLADKTKSNVHGSQYAFGVVSTKNAKQYSFAESVSLNWAYWNEKLTRWHPTQDILYYVADDKLWATRFSEDALLVHEPLYPECGAVATSTLAFTRDGKYAIVGLDAVQLSEYDLLYATKLALFPVDGGEPKIVSLPENYLFKGLITGNSSVAWEPNPHQIALFAVNKEKSTRRTMLAIDCETCETTLLWEGQEKIVPFGFSADHKTIYGCYEDFYTPTDIYLFDGQFNRIKNLSNAEPAFETLDVGSVEYFVTDIPDSSGKIEKVTSAILLPEGAKKGDKLPSIVIIYPGADNTDHCREFGGGDDIGGIPCWLLTQNGFAVILPNLDRGKEAIGRPLEAMTERLLPQVYKAHELGYIDITRVGLMGQSYGGYGTAGIISHTNLFRAACATNGLYDLASSVYSIDSQGVSFWIPWAELDQGFMGKLFYDDPLRYITNSPFYRADKIQTPLLLIHGMQDDAYADAGKLFAALRRLDKEVTLVAYHDGWHIIGWMRREEHLDAAKKILEFFRKHL